MYMSVSVSETIIYKQTFLNTYLLYSRAQKKTFVADTYNPNGISEG